MRVIIADDDREIRLSLTAILKMCEHEVVECQDGAEAWKAMQPPDVPGLAILDWDMPEMTGIEVCRLAKAEEATRPVHILLLTGRTEEEHLVAALEAGADDFVTKPFRARELAARVGVGLRIAELQVQFLKAEQDRVVAEMAGAAAHEINQPLTVLCGQAEMLLMMMPEGDPKRKRAESIIEAGEEIGGIVKQMKAAKGYVSKPYIFGANIVDLKRASGEDRDPGQ